MAQKSLPQLEHHHVIEAIERIRDEGVPPGFKKSTGYDLLHEGKRYPPKAVAAVAAELATGREWGAHDFSGGEGRGRSNEVLRQLGFVVESKRRHTETGDRSQIDGSRRYWVEKTVTEGRDDRRAGQLALGHAMWSPQRSRDDRDLYHAMREVSPGDVVLLLTDNAGVSGVALVAGVVSHELNGQPFRGVEGTDWHGIDCQWVRLEGYQPLNPILDREWFLNPDVLGEFESKHRFFNKRYELNQGAYLTEAPARMVERLSHAYHDHTGKWLPYTSDLVPLSASLQDAFRAFAQATLDAGLEFGPTTHDAFLSAFLSSVATKRFVILTGLSGSGKTQIARMFGHWLGPDRYCNLPVRPDWTGPEALLGYEDALSERPKGGGRPWHTPQALAFMLKAARDSARPYLLLLDEMNLAHVERYFADVLSGMESGDPCLPNVHEVDGRWLLDEETPSVPLPDNLFVLGTVNVDETTYMFSPKVLDRANTIEFRVGTGDLPTDPRAMAGLRDCEPGDEGEVRALLAVARDPQWHVDNLPGWIDEFAEKLRVVHGLLSPHGFEFGHRVYAEAVRFAAIHAAMGGESMGEALDLQLMQKVLPRLHGARRRLEPVLRAVGHFAEHLEHGEAAEKYDPAAPGEAVQLPLTSDKVRRMTVRLRQQQFASFAE